MSDAVWEITIMGDTLFLIGVVLWYKDVYCMSCVYVIFVLLLPGGLYLNYITFVLCVCVCVRVQLFFLLLYSLYVVSLSPPSPSLFLSLSASLPHVYIHL